MNSQGVVAMIHNPFFYILFIKVKINVYIKGVR